MWLRSRYSPKQDSGQRYNILLLLTILLNPSSLLQGQHSLLCKETCAIQSWPLEVLLYKVVNFAQKGTCSLEVSSEAGLTVKIYIYCFVKMHLKDMLFQSRPWHRPGFVFADLLVCG